RPPRSFTATVTLVPGMVAPLASLRKPKYGGPSSAESSSSSPNPAPPAHATVARMQVMPTTTLAIDPRRFRNLIPNLPMAGGAPRRPHRWLGVFYPIGDVMTTAERTT